MVCLNWKTSYLKLDASSRIEHITTVFVSNPDDGGNEKASLAMNDGISTFFSFYFSNKFRISLISAIAGFGWLVHAFLFIGISLQIL